MDTIDRHSREPFDWRGLYAIVDPSRCAGDPLAFASALLRGGVSVLQLRAKRLEDVDRLGLGRKMASLARAHHVPFVFDDRVDMALLCDADGVHLGQRDLPVQAARRLAPSLHVGRSTHDLNQVDEALASGADAIAFGPVFPTSSKEGADPVVGLRGLREAAERIGASRPLIAIGGLTPSRARAAAEHGARMVAVIGALSKADDPERAVRAFLEALRGTGAHPDRRGRTHR